MFKSQAGFVTQTLILIVLGAGLAAAIYLTQTGNLKLFSKASAPRSLSPETSFTLVSSENCFKETACKEIAIKLYARSDIESANLFTAKMLFPSNLVEVKEIATNNSFVKNWVEDFYDNGKGTISLTGGIPSPGFQTKTGEESALFATVVFNVKTEGRGLIDFSDESAIYSNLNNLNLLTVKKPYEIIADFSLKPSYLPDQTFETGLEAGEQHDSSRVPLVSESGAKWVRLNFVGGNWNSGSGDVSKYNSIINDYTRKGLKIIGLIGAQSVAGGYDRNDPEGFGQKLLNVSDQIIARFGDRVRVYELFNEANDWAGGSSSQVTERYFAQYLSRIYRKIKIEQKKKEIFLISGPLFSFDLNTGAAYLQSTYDEGKTLPGQDSWNAVKAESGSYPLDGVGYHIYVAQGMNDMPDVEAKFRGNLSAVESVIAANDPGKQLWITEFGWGTGTGRVSEDVQAQNMSKVFGILRNDPRVKLGMWFTLKDFDDSEWGLIRQDGIKKKAWSAFQKINSGPQPTIPPANQACSASLSFACGNSGKHRLDAVWNLKEKYGSNSCNVYVRDDRGDHQINGSNNAGSCAGSRRLDSLEGNPIFAQGHYQLFASNGDPEGVCYNQLRADVIVNCASTAEKTKGDINSDGKISLIDMSALLSKWNKTGKADLNEDGIVNAVDYSMLIKILAENKVIRS